MTRNQINKLLAELSRAHTALDEATMFCETCHVAILSDVMRQIRDVKRNVGVNHDRT